VDPPRPWRSIQLSRICTCGRRGSFIISHPRRSPQEAGRYLETYKAYESKTADPLKEKIDNTYLARVCRLRALQTVVYKAVEIG
jgi:hypothetical protein